MKYIIEHILMGIGVMILLLTPMVFSPYVFVVFSSGKYDKIMSDIHITQNLTEEYICFFIGLLLIIIPMMVKNKRKKCNTYLKQN